MSKYKYLIFDVDDTLLNFYAAFKSAQTAIAEKLNIPCSKAYMELDEKCGWKAWKKSDLDNTNSLDIQKIITPTTTGMLKIITYICYKNCKCLQMLMNWLTAI